MANWRNDDNLLVKFGADKAAAAAGGEFMTMGGEHILEFDIDLTALTLTTPTILPNMETVWIPKAHIITMAEIIITETPTGSSATLDLGLAYYTAAGVQTELDYNGIVAVAAWGSFGAIGDVHWYKQDGSVPTATVQEGAYLGKLIPTTAEKYYLFGNAAAAAFTAGAIKVKLHYFKPGALGL